MTMEIVVEGIGPVGGFGAGIDKLSSALVAPPGPTSTVPIRWTDGDGEVPTFLADTSSLDSFVPRKALRRIDHFSRMALLAAHLALQDAGMLGPNLGDLGVVVASGYGASQTTFAFLDSFIDGNEAYSSPTHFSGSVHNAPAAYISILLGITGPCLTVSQFEMSVPSALVSALRWLEEGRVEKVLFGAVDEYCSVLGYCWHRFFGPPRRAAIEPFLFDQQTAIPGEGAIFFLISRKKGPKNRYGRIARAETGWAEEVKLPPPEHTLFILGADGHRKCGIHYESGAKNMMSVASYTPIYGSFPTNTAFDMAVGLLSVKEERIFAPPAGIFCPPSLGIAAGGRTKEGSQICCLKYGRRGESGLIALARD